MKPKLSALQWHQQQDALLSEQELQQKARERAFALLARRDYSQTQLMRKLQARFGTELTQTILQDLALKGWQSDLRFAQGFYRESIRLGRGPIRIGYELKQKGISAEVMQAVEAWLDSGEDLHVDWCALAQEVYSRKYGETPIKEVQEKQKRMRFMQARGFAFEHFRDLI
jgi:regulatory protein